MKKLLLLLTTALVATSATAEEVGHNVRDYEKFSPDFLGPGIRRGAFLIKPSIGVDETYKDNIYSTQTNEKSDFITSLKLSLTGTATNLFLKVPVILASIKTRLTKTIMTITFQLLAALISNAEFIQM